MLIHLVTDAKLNIIVYQFSNTHLYIYIFKNILFEEYILNNYN